MFETLDQLTDALLAACEAESQSKWIQGDFLVEATTPNFLDRVGMTKRAVLEHAGKSLGRGARTIYKRLQASATFPEGERNTALSWEIHYVASCTDNPRYWLEIAANDLLSCAQLELAIKAANGEPEHVQPDFLLRAAEMWAIPGDGVWVLYAPDRAQPSGAMRVIVSMTEAEAA